MKCHRTFDEFSHCGCDVLELALWKCGGFVMCYDGGIPQISKEGLVEGTNSCIPKGEGS
jgi:hypothetical protein